MSKAIDLTGKVYGQWTVIERAENKNNDTYWTCRCSCGNVVNVRGKDMRYGKSTKCIQCSQRESSAKLILMKNDNVHGMSREPLYRVHINMIERCINPNVDAYCNYGARGIKVCDEWADVTKFIKWAKDNGWKPGLQIDRIDNDGDYEPSNCRFVTPKQNARNRRNKREYEWNGMIKCSAGWAEYWNVDVSYFDDRLRRGWDMEEAALTPKLKNGQKRRKSK